MSFRLQDLIDIKKFQKLQDRLNEIHSFPSSIIDNDGNILTATAWQDICAQFHRKNKDAETLCIQSDQYIKDHIHEANPAVSYRCPHGLVDNATPIIIDGIHYGNFFTGQFFLEEPNMNFFKDQAKVYGFEEKAYLDAVKRVPVWTQKQLDNYLFFIKELIEVIAESGLKKLKEIEAKKKSEKSEERLRSVSDQIPGMLYQFVLHSDGTYSIPYVSDKVHEFLGYSPDQITNQPQLFFSSIHPDDAGRLNDGVRKSADELTDFEMQIRFISQKNETTWFGFRSAAIRLENGDTFWNGISIDITEQKALEEELKSQAKIFNAIFNSAPNIMLLVNNEGRVDKINHKGVDFSGRDEKELIGLLGGEVFNCLTSFDGKGCGRNPECSYCPIRTRVGDTFSTGNPHHEEEGRMTFLMDGKIATLDLLISTKLIELDGFKQVLVSITDVTILKEAEYNYRIMAEMLNEAPNSITIHDFDGNFLFANNKTFKIHGYTADEFMKLNLRNVDVPESEALINQRMKMILEKGEASFTVSHLRKDGSTIPMEVFVKLVQWKDKPALMSIATDITQRIHAERELNESRGNLMALIENTDDTIVSRDLLDRAIVFNQAFVRTVKLLFGVKAEPGMRTLDYLPDQDRDHWENILSTVKKGLRFKEEHSWDFDGDLRWYETAFHPIKVDGKVIGTAEFTRDITERKLAEKEVQEISDRLKLATGAARLGIWDWDIKNNRLVWDEGMYTLYGIQKDDFSNTFESWLNRIHPDDREDLDLVLLEARQGDREYDTEFRIVWPNGAIKHIKAIGQVFWDSERNPIRMTGVNFDITEKKEIELLLQQAQKMEAIGTLAGGIAHDFNNILFPIVGMSELMLEDLPIGSPDHENLSGILQAGRRGSDLVKQILAFSRQTKHQMMPIKMHHILKEVLKLVRSTIPANIEIKQNIQHNCGLVYADPTHIHQVAMNLITNAYHALESTGGKIVVELQETEIDQEKVSCLDLKPGKYATLMVSDTGCGIPADIMGKIFDPYFTTKEQGKGTGLGLAVVHGIVKEHHGEIKVYSEVGHGTGFHVYLPIIEEGIAEDKPKTEIIDLSGNENILIVDDEEAIVRLEKQMLERLGYHITERTSSPDALKAFSKKPYAYDLVITDMTMPNMTGEELARELIAIRPDIPIIICTGFSERLGLKARPSFIKGILMKPILKNDLAKMIRNILGPPRSSVQP